MPDTTSKGFPYPEGPDPVDVAGDIQALAEAIDDMPGVQSYTGAQIAALTAGEKWAGRIVWNSTTGKLQVSNGSTFSDVDTSLALSSTTPAALGVAAVGNGTTAARDNHVHAMPSASDVGAVANALLTNKGDLLARSSSAPARLGVGSNGQALVADSAEALGVKRATVGGSTAPSLLSKSDLWSVCLTRTGAGTAQIKAGTKVLVGTTLVEFSTATSITMPSLTAGTDYYVYVSNTGTAQAVAATGAWPTPVGSPPANSQLIGGFHYAPGGNASGTSGGNTTPGINEYSLWDLKWRPTSLDPRGMTLVADAFWMDIYLLNRAPALAVDVVDAASAALTAAWPLSLAARRITVALSPSMRMRRISSLVTSSS